MQKLIAFIFITIILSSCRGQESFIDSRLKTVDKFVKCLENNTPDKILDFAFPGIDQKFKDKASRDFYVNKASKFIKKFGLPSKDKWIIKYDPTNDFERLLVTIPIFKGYDSTFNLSQADIVIAFPPPQISYKIYKFDIEDKYNIERAKPIFAPLLRTDATKTTQ